MPSGIPYIIGNEAAERFSYYGMKAILFVFMTEYLVNRNGEMDLMSENEANFWIHMFGTATYFFPILGALVADIAWGKYRTIILLSLLYCAGHIALAMDETRLGLSLGLTMIAIGSGGIKPCVSAHVGDQFTTSNNHLLERVFSYFYLSINLGAAISQILTPIFLHEVGPSLAFGVPGALMILATFVFWLGRTRFTTVPAAGWERYRKEVFSKEGLGAIGRLSFIYIFIAVFWSLFDQTASSWIGQAKSEYLIKTIDLGFISFTLRPAQIQAANPILILILVPLFTYFIYPGLKKVMNLTPLKKINIGLFIAAISFGIVALIEENLTEAIPMSVGWQFLAYVVLTAAEVMVSVTALEFSYSQAPNAMKSLIMGFYLLSVSLGNFFTALVNYFIENVGADWLAGAGYFWFFTVLMAVTGLGFIFVTLNYKGKTYIQGGPDAVNPEEWQNN